MDEQQPNEQTGFRPNSGIHDAFVALECLFSKSLEWNAPIWFASLALTKAVDRIDYRPLIDATSPSESSEFVDVCGEMVHVFHAETVHKYLGRNLSGNFLARRNYDFAHRWQVAWNKFHKYKQTILNKYVFWVLRLKLFDAVVSPAMLFGPATLPLTKGCLQKLGVVQTRMLRSIIGWVRSHDDLSWRDIMVQMNHKLVIAKTLFPMERWEDRLFRSKLRLAHRIAHSPERWPAKSVSWNPLTNRESNFVFKPHRKRGRPSTRLG